MQVGDLGRLAPCSRQRHGKRMGRGAGKGHRDRQRFGRNILQVGRLRHAKGQGAGLVEDHRVNLGQTLQRGAMFDQQTLAEQLAAGRRHHGRHRKTKGAGAGNDQYGGGNVDGKANVATGDPHPCGKGPKGQQVHARRIEPRRPVGQRSVVGLGALGDRHQIGHAMQRGVLASGSHPHRQRAGQIDFARTDHRARPGIGRQAFPGQQRPVQLAAALCHDAIDRHPPARTHQHDITNRNL